MDNNLKKLQNPDMIYWPDVRWWLAEGLHTDETLKYEVDLLNKSGFGAIEFLAMEEPGIDHTKYGWGAEEWVHDSHTLVDETTKRGMGVSLTCGTNWSNANLITINPDDPAAAQEIDFIEETVKAGETREGELKMPKLFMPGVTKQTLIAVTATKIVGEKDGKTVLDPKTSYVLTDQVKDGMLTWTAPADGDYLLCVFTIHGTGQTASPSCSTSWTVNYMDHYGIDAFIKYWDEEVVVGEMKENLEKNGRAMMYMDSLELSTFGRGGQLWGFNYLDEFKARRGYDVTPYLPLVMKKPGMMQPVYHYYYTCEDQVFFLKLENDLYQTTTDMYCENMMKPMQEWLHGHNMTLRSEISYGLPFEISQPGKYVDGIETESLEFASQIDSYRGLAGAAHVYNRTFSSETGATMYNYMKGLDFYTQIIYTQLAAGVTKTVLHGYSSIRGSEQATYWPGHEGMWPVFSERFGSRQPAFRHYDYWTKAVARYQMIMRQGAPRVDLAMLRLDYNFNNQIAFVGGKGEDFVYEDSLMRANDALYWKDMTLQNNGYTWDYFAPQLLEEDFVDFKDGKMGPGYKALIIYQNTLPVESAKKILAMAKKGLPVVFANGCTETIRPGVDVTYNKAAEMTPFNDGRDAELAEIVAAIKALPTTKEVDVQADTYAALLSLGVKPAVTYGEPNKKILTQTKDDNGKKYVFVYNMMYTDTEPTSYELKLEGYGRLYKVDCWNAKITQIGCYRKEDGYTAFDVTMAPGEGSIYVLDTTEADEVYAVKTDAAAIEIVDGKLVAKAYKSGSYTAELSDGSMKQFDIVSADAIDVPVWKLSVEDWNEGEKKEIIEDRGLGLVTKEVYFETAKTMLPEVETELKAWKDIPGVGPDVSGVGYYTQTVDLPELKPGQGVEVVIGGANKQTVGIQINGRKGPAVDIDALTVDITDYVVPGENTITIEATSTLNNRLKARGYYEMSAKISQMVAENANNANTDDMDENGALQFNIVANVLDYGITGGVSVRTYSKVSVS